MIVKFYTWKSIAIHFWYTDIVKPNPASFAQQNCAPAIEERPGGLPDMKYNHNLDNSWNLEWENFRFLFRFFSSNHTQSFLISQKKKREMYGEYDILGENNIDR